MRRLAFAGLAAMTLVLGTAPVSAQSIYGTQRDVVVHYGDLNVGHPAGASILLDRLYSASRQACRDAYEIRDLGLYRIYMSCLRHTMDRAVADASVHAPMVADLYVGRPIAMAEYVPPAPPRRVAHHRDRRVVVRTAG